MGPNTSSSPELGVGEKREVAVDDATNNNEKTLASDDVQVDDIDEILRSVQAYSPEEAKRILRKVDYRLIPLLTLLYLLAFIDRGNIANAKIAGLETDLHLVGSQYNIALTLFFVPYGLFEVPSNVILKLLPPSAWIAIMMLAWGTVTT
ncbi:hypothetical protein MferCBS31731_002066 [Microsporum ferrugineum]